MRKKPWSNQHKANTVYMPSPEQIRAACEEIRAEWSPEEEQSRRVRDGQVRMDVIRTLVLRETD